MKVKTITASSIHAALMEARRHLGDEVVLLESVPAEGDNPARITVMAEAAERPRLPTAAGEPAARQAGRSKTPAARRKEGNGFGYHARQASAEVAVAQEESAPARERLSGPAERNYGVNVGRRTVRDLMSDDEAPAYPEPRRRSLSGPAGRGQLFPIHGERVPQSAPNLPAASFDGVEKLLKAQLELLHNRLDKLERRFGGAIIGAGQTWTTNPLFSDLLTLGFRPGTVTKLFDTLAAKGFQPDTDDESLKWALAQEIRRSISQYAVRETHGAQVFVGPSGSGKTSLLLKLARHAGFYGRRQTAVIAIGPEDAERAFHNSPVDLFRRHGLPVQTVSSLDEMRAAVQRVQHFDHILIDTPALPLQPNASRKALRHIKRLVDPILPLSVQLVMNATRTLDDFDADAVRNLPLRPDAVALTHLDETPGWGRVAEWLVALEMPVQYLSTSPDVPDGVISFSPSWFVEEMMKL